MLPTDLDRCHARRPSSVISWSGNTLPQVAEWLVGGDQHRATLEAGADQLEQHADFGLIMADVGEFVEEEQMLLVELGERAFEPATCHLQALHEPLVENRCRYAMSWTKTRRYHGNRQQRCTTADPAKRHARFAAH